ncbi:MAG: hypothetical protein ACI85O_000662 [Saprospiraceae bacterium]|jgi:hypothetical protein
MTIKNWIIALIASCIPVAIFLFLRDEHSNIKAGYVSYTYNCAWVDWKHARPEGIKVFIDEFNQKFAQTPLNETFKITYGQQGGHKIKGHSLYSYSISKEYEVLKLSADETTKKKLMFQIFKDVSYLFEKQQENVFWRILKASSFREGDLMGSLIGFYIACGEITQEEASELCKELPVSVSLQLKRDNKSQANISFVPKYRIVVEDNIPTFPTLLSKYNDLEGLENYILPLEEMEKITLLGNNLH